VARKGAERVRGNEQISRTRSVQPRGWASIRLKAPWVQRGAALNKPLFCVSWRDGGRCGFHRKVERVAPGERGRWSSCANAVVRQRVSEVTSSRFGSLSRRAQRVCGRCDRSQERASHAVPDERGLKLSRLKAVASGSGVDSANCSIRHRKPTPNEDAASRRKRDDGARSG